MNGGTTPSAGKEISPERQMLKRSLALGLIALVPFIYSVPNILIVRELQSMMPVEVLGPEAFDPDPFMDMMPKYAFPWGLREMTA